MTRTCQSTWCHIPEDSNLLITKKNGVEAAIWPPLLFLSGHVFRMTVIGLPACHVPPCTAHVPPMTIHPPPQNRTFRISQLRPHTRRCTMMAKINFNHEFKLKNKWGRGDGVKDWSNKYCQISKQIYSFVSLFWNGIGYKANSLNTVLRVRHPVVTHEKINRWAVIHSCIFRQYLQ